MNLEQFATKHKIGFSAEEIDHRPDNGLESKLDREWNATASHWKCTLRTGPKKSMTIYNSRGSGLTGAPTRKDILESLLGDVRGALGSTFEQWADEMDVDADSRRGERIFKLCRKMAGELKRMIGPKAFAEFLEIDLNENERTP